jgi:hypothetical protein
MARMNDRRTAFQKRHPDIEFVPPWNLDPDNASDDWIVITPDNGTLRYGPRADMMKDLEARYPKRSRR